MWINTFMDMILEFISDKPWFGLIAAIIAAAAAFCAATPTPKEGSWVSKIYKVVEFLALNIGKAKAKAVVEEKVEETVKSAVSDAVKKATKKNLEPLVNKEIIRKYNRLKCINPLLIVKSLKGIGEKPAIASKVIQAIIPPSEEILFFQKDGSTP